MRLIRHCPICQAPTTEQWTWLGILHAVFCFPCGIYCCMRRKRVFCTTCDIDVIVADGTVPRLVQTYKYYKEYVTKEPFHHTQRTQDSTSASTVATSAPSVMSPVDSSSGAK